MTTLLHDQLRSLINQHGSDKLILAIQALAQEHALCSICDEPTGDDLPGYCRCDPYCGPRDCPTSSHPQDCRCAVCAAFRSRKG